MRISVVIPCYQAGHYLRESVASALSQDGEFDLREVIVVDDQSPDVDTEIALNEVAAQRGVRVLENRGSKGSAAARNVGIKAARGDWLVFLDADDWLLPGSIDSRCRAARDNQACEWVGADFLTLDRDGSMDPRGYFESRLDHYPFLAAAYAADPRSVTLCKPAREFFQQAPTNIITTLVKRELIRRVGGFDERLLRQQDYHLFLRLARSADFVFVPQPVAVRRLHDNNSTRFQTLTQEWRVTALCDLKRQSAFSDFHQTIDAGILELLLSNAYQFRREKRFALALRSSARAVCRNPRSKAGWKCVAASLLRRQ